MSKTPRKTKRAKPAHVEVSDTDKRAVGLAPQPYRPDAAMKLLREMTNGKSMREIIAEDPEFYPSRSIIWEWRQDIPEFDAAYLKARRGQVESFFDDITGLPDTAHKLTEAEQAWVGLRIKARQIYIEKAAPRDYGARIEQHHTGQNDNSPMIDVLRNLTSEEREELRALIIKAQQRAEDQRQGGLLISGTARRSA